MTFGPLVTLGSGGWPQSRYKPQLHTNFAKVHNAMKQRPTVQASNPNPIAEPFGLWPSSPLVVNGYVENRQVKKNLKKNDLRATSTSWPSPSYHVWHPYSPGKFPICHEYQPDQRHRGHKFHSPAAPKQGSGMV